MGTLRQLQGLGAFIGRRWQGPAALVAVGLAAAAIMMARPTKHEVPFESLFADVHALIEKQKFGEAANACANLLDFQPAFSVEQQARLHALLADIIYEREHLRLVPNGENAALLLEHHASAIAMGHRVTPEAMLRAAEAHEWLSDVPHAIEGYRVVLDRVTEPQTRRVALQALVRLLDGRSQFESERRQHAEALLAEEGTSPAYVWWTLQHGMQQALDEGDVPRARAILEKHGERFKRSDLEGYYNYLWAWQFIHEGRSDEARPMVAWVDQWLAEHGRADVEMDRAGFLPAMNRWLAGRVDLSDFRPQSALDHFNAALRLDPYGELSTRSSIGRAEALAMLERHAAARDEVMTTVSRLGARRNALVTALPRLRRCLVELHGARVAAEDFGEAVEYLRLAVNLAADDEAHFRMNLLELLGRAAAQAGDASHNPRAARQYHREAGERFEEAAGIAKLDAERRGELLWLSARYHGQSGELAAQRRTLESFVDGREKDSRLPSAYLQLGQACAELGDAEQAVRTYEHLIAKYSPLDETLRARMKLAELRINQGEAHYAQAEQILLDLLEGEGLAPAAGVFRDALFALCDLYFDQNRYGDVISRAEDFLVLYPEDTDSAAMRFVLADSYRLSAYALRDEADSARDPREAHLESQRRFERAAQLFGEMLAIEQSRDPHDAAALPEQFQRWALFYLGDCHFELNDPQSLEQALSRYQQAAVRYQGDPAALTAQVQIANIHLRQGRTTDAARAIERARWLLQAIPEGAFARAPGGVARADWEKFLGRVAGSELFQELFAESP